MAKNPRSVSSSSSVQISMARQNKSEDTPYGLVKLRQVAPAGSVRRFPPGPVDNSLTLQPVKPARDARDWRAKAGFPVPSTPELVSHDPDLVHSQSMAFASDRGIRYVRAEWPDVAPCTVSLQREKALIGLSLRKYSAAYLESSAATYPGIDLCR